MVTGAASFTGSHSVESLLARGCEVLLISAGRSIRFFGDGSFSRDYTCVTDIMQGVLRAIERTRSPVHAH